MKTVTETKRVNAILDEAKAMIQRVEFFGQLYNFNDEFLKDAEHLKETVDQFEDGIIKDVNEIVRTFGDFTKKYTKYIEETIKN